MITDSKHKNPINLGLVCQTFDTTIRFKHITKTYFDKLNAQEKKSKLIEIYNANIISLDKAYDYCINNNIRLYRLYSQMFPFWDTQLGANVLTHNFSQLLKNIGSKFIKNNIRLVAHPEQFVVLNSDNNDTIKNSISILEAHALMFDLMGCAMNNFYTIIIHGGKAGAQEKLINTIKSLPINIRSRLALENDEICYSSEQMFNICQKAGVPMIFDAHHHVCKELLDSFDDKSVSYFLKKARQTWQPNLDWQLVHISNGDSSFNDRKHSQIITQMPECYKDVLWIEIEAKNKEQAIEYLRNNWLNI